MVWFMDRRVEDKSGSLYDLEKDPGETVNLYGKPEYQPVMRRLESLARQWDERRREEGGHPTSSENGPHP